MHGGCLTTRLITQIHMLIIWIKNAPSKYSNRSKAFAMAKLKKIEEIEYFGTGYPSTLFLRSWKITGIFVWIGQVTYQFQRDQICKLGVGGWGRGMKEYDSSYQSLPPQTHTHTHIQTNKNKQQQKPSTSKMRWTNKSKRQMENLFTKMTYLCSLSLHKVKTMIQNTGEGSHSNLIVSFVEFITVHIKLCDIQEKFIFEWSLDFHESVWHLGGCLLHPLPAVAQCVTLFHLSNRSLHVIFVQHGKAFLDNSSLH